MTRYPRVYIMASVSRVLYIGVTSDLEGRVFKHKAKLAFNRIEQTGWRSSLWSIAESATI